MTFGRGIEDLEKWYVAFNSARFDYIAASDRQTGLVCLLTVSTRFQILRRADFRGNHFKNPAN